MGRYWKAWGSLAGSIVGVLAAYSLVPEGAESTVLEFFNIAGPVVGGVLGTWLAPKNEP